MSSSPKNKRPMEADPSSREEQVQAKRRGPRREEAPALLPMPAGRARLVNYSKWLNAETERKRREAELGLTPPVEEAQVPTLEYFEPPTTFHTERLLHVRESGSMAVLTAAKSLLGVSSSVGGKPLKRCSGFWIDWDEESKTGTVLTTAHLIRTKKAPTNIWSGGEEYDPHANVTVHLLDGTSAEGQLLYHQPHYDVAFVRVFQTMRRRYKYIPRPHLGMTFVAIKLLEPAHVDKIWRMYNIDNGLVVQKVSKGSHAEKFGIQIGDIIECCNGESVSTTVELENMLMSICKGSSDNLNGLNVEVNVSILSSKLPVVCRLGSLSISTQ
uniref:ATP binding protein n=1 Tax=Brachypodium sylvaticum TaxID=29664 RepID=C3TX94_BRASY|nr:ATP binding protein [Brachypodium sylvaticum]